MINLPDINKSIIEWRSDSLKEQHLNEYTEQIKNSRDSSFSHRPAALRFLRQQYRNMPLKPQIKICTSQKKTRRKYCNLT